MSNSSTKNSEAKYEKFHEKTRSIGDIPETDNFTYGSILIQIESLVSNKNNLEILDLGCGPGSVSFYLLKKSHKVVGVDISNIAIDSCKKTAKDHGFSEGEFVRSTVEKYVKGTRKKFDLIIMSELIEHLENESLVLGGVKRLLKRGGSVFISTPSINAPLYRMGLLKDFDKRVGHLRRYSVSSLRAVVGGSGLQVAGIIKAEGVMRNAIFNIRGLGFIVRVLNKFPFIGKIFATVDKLLMHVFGESDLQLTATTK